MVPGAYLLGERVTIQKLGLVRNCKGGWEIGMVGGATVFFLNRREESKTYYKIKSDAEGRGNVAQGDVC